MSQTIKPLFAFGQVVSTPGALAQVSPEEMALALTRHSSGDWGQCGDEDRKANDAALMQGSRLFSVYVTTEGTKFWIITEADRSATRVLLPEEY